MKLRFEQVLDYLEAGADDPEFEDFLKNHPDGPRMLAEAKRLHALLHEQAEEDGGDEDDVAGAAQMSVKDDALESFDMEAPAAELRVPGELFENDLRDLSSKDVMVAAKLAQRAASSVRNLGELTIVARKADMLLSFEPAPPRTRPGPRRSQLSSKLKDGTETFYQSASSPRMRESDDAFMGFMSGRASTGELKIRGMGIEISAPGTQEQYEAIRLSVADTRLRIPARGLELIFMPEHGPFKKLVTDSKGVVELPMPEQPGVLRIEGKVPQLLTIRLEY